MSMKHEQVLASPRRRVRFVYLADAWPEAKQMDPLDAILTASDEAVIAALTTEVERYAEVINEERERADRAERDLADLRRGLKLVAAAMREQAEATAALTLFDLSGVDA